MIFYCLKSLQNVDARGNQMSITIDKEFESLIPPLSPEEFQQLEENCVKEGIRDG